MKNIKIMFCKNFIHHPLWPGNKRYLNNRSIENKRRFTNPYKIISLFSISLPSKGVINLTSYPLFQFFILIEHMLGDTTIPWIEIRGYNRFSCLGIPV